MPVFKTDTNALQYGRLVGQAYYGHPRTFLEEEELEIRMNLARFRTIEAIRFSERLMVGRGLCQEVRGLDGTIDSLVDFVDEIDGKRARKVRKFNQMQEQGLPLPHRAPRSPQNVSARRSALFGGSDIPEGFLEDMYEGILKEEIVAFVELMRWMLVQDAITQMVELHELEFMNDIWTLKTSTLDRHTAELKHGSNRVKQDDRSFHGRPNRDRGTVAA